MQKEDSGLVKAMCLDKQYYPVWCLMRAVSQCSDLTLFLEGDRYSLLKFLPTLGSCWG